VARTGRASSSRGASAGLTAARGVSWEVSKGNGAGAGENASIAVGRVTC